MGKEGREGERGRRRGEGRGGEGRELKDPLKGLLGGLCRTVMTLRREEEEEEELAWLLGWVGRPTNASLLSPPPSRSWPS